MRQGQQQSFSPSSRSKTTTMDEEVKDIFDGFKLLSLMEELIPRVEQMEAEKGFDDDFEMALEKEVRILRIFFCVVGCCQKLF